MTLCVSLTQCLLARYIDLGVACRSERTLLKPGRKPAAVHQYKPQDPHLPVYPVLQKLLPFGIGDGNQRGQPSRPSLCSTDDACRLLENFFSSPDQIPHGMVLRGASFLRSEGYRECNAALLLSILCLSCYMPTASGGPPLTHLGHSERARLRNAVHASALEVLEPVFLCKTEASFDDALATFILCSVTTSDDENHRYLPHRIFCFNFLIKQLHLNMEPESFSAEEREERRRLWWVAYIVDKHSSFSFNLRPVLAESACQHLRRPCPDAVWASSGEFVDPPDDENNCRKGLDYEVHSLDWFGVLVPLAAILADLLEYHYLLQHPSFGSSPELLGFLRKALLENMAKFNTSARALQQSTRRASTARESGVAVMVWDAGQLRDLDGEFPAEPKLLLYAWHMLHCMYTILYGKLDLVHMFQDTAWLLSNDFLVAAEHADKCTIITTQILRLDPKLHGFYRLFGTYFLQSSFIFLVLARKLRDSADEYILNSCRTYLRTLEAFAATVNISYQKTFARVLQDTISKCVDAPKDPQQPQPHPDGQPAIAAADDWLDPAILNYRWTAGYSGLWNGEMGRPSEAKKRKFEL